MKVKELLKLDTTVDVGNDYSDEFTDEDGVGGFCALIAFVGPSELTEEGQKHFNKSLDFDVDVSSNYATVHIPGETDEEKEENLTNVMILFYALSGNISNRLFNLWIKDK